ncbi:MAG TPA: molybdate ABC transporter substrate-binding protein [Trueperaceae bacterium]|nr:molybdate ABC transporter substrate-binding protein [Trueperaceae bacterium]
MLAPQLKGSIGERGQRSLRSATIKTAVLMATAGVLLTASLTSLATAQTLTVFAASSLTESFEELAVLFEREHPGVDVNLNLAGSAILALQVIEGAPADVFASADLRQLQRVAAAGLVADEPTVFARNRLVVVAAKGSGVETFADLADKGLVLVMAGPSVPAGHYAREAITSADAARGDDFATKVMANVVSEEQNVRLVAAKVALGEADAGIVYATDAAVFPQLRSVRIPSEHDPLASYAIAVVSGGRQVELARAFVAMVTSEAGAAVLAAHGFSTAGPP